ncbi:MAG TPA: SDR family oxidoreductase [Chthoniobacterales bacterium]|nr:SDR family oxidoreductase [Chthoniobacterales bacterium]
MQKINSPRVIVVTGASAGLGRAIAQAFARSEAARIGLIARGKDGLEGAKREVENQGGQALIVPADVANADGVEAAADRVESELGPIDVWVNDAMTGVFAPVKEMTAAEFKRVTEVTFLGFVNGTLAALKRMLPRDQGRIIQIGSALAYRGIPLQAAYCASKHAIQGFMDSLRCELLHDKSHVRVTMVQMPAMNTPQFDWIKSRLPKRAQPVPPIFQPEVAAEAVVYASRHNRREIYVGMPSVKAIVANKLFPGLLDHYLAHTGYKSQQTDELEDPHRPYNLYEPVTGDHGAHGRFDDRSRTSSAQLWTDLHRDGLVAFALLGAVALAAGALAKNKNDR